MVAHSARKDDSRESFSAGVWNKDAATKAALRVKHAREQAAKESRYWISLKRKGFPMLSAREVDALRNTEIECLGSGHFGTASLVRWRGTLAVLKKAFKAASLEQFISEMDALEYIQGAGGAPKPFGLCLNPLAILISYEGPHTLDDFLEEPRTDDELLDVAVDLCRKVAEIHRKDVIHTDLKRNNVVVDDQQKVHVIDFGNAALRGTLFYYENEGKDSSWLPPEIFSEIPIAPAQDAFSVGQLLLHIAEEMESPLGLREIVDGLVERDQTKRHTLDEALARLKNLRPTSDAEYDLQEVESFSSF